MNTTFLMLTLALGIAARAADTMNWREIWDGDKRDWWKKSIPELRGLRAEKNPFATMILADKLWTIERAEAIKLRQEAVDLGFPQAMVWLSEAEGTPYTQKISLITRAAELGHPAGQREAARYYYHRGVRPDYDKTLALLRAAADQGDTEAKSDLAELYAAGIGEPRNEKEKPINILRELAAKGDESVEDELERRLRLGIGTEIDLLEAAYYYYRDKSRRLAAQTRFPSPIAQRYNIREDHAGMIVIVRQSAIRHDPNRQIVEQLDALFDNALTHHDNAALLELAKFHENGTHGKTNLARACALLTLANFPDAAAKSKGLTPEQSEAMQHDLRWMRR